MIPHTQTRLHMEGGEYGDCWPTSIESVLDLPLGTLPRWEQGQDWGDYWYSIMAYLYHHHGLVSQKVSADLLAGRVQASGYHLVIGQSPRATPEDPIYHAVVGKDGEVVHDPHPSRAGVVRSESWEFLVPAPERWRDPEVYYPAGRPCPCGSCPASQQKEVA